MVYINKAEAPATMVALSADVYTSNLASMHTSSMLCKCVPKGSVNDIEKVREVEVDLKKKKKRVLRGNWVERNSGKTTSKRTGNAR